MIAEAKAEDAELLCRIGAESFIASHKESAPAHEIDTYVDRTYSLSAIKKELANSANIYHLIKHNGQVAGFSKMELNRKHPAVPGENVSKMDQIYLLQEFYGLRLGAKLLEFNIDLSNSNGQSGMWLVVWVGNHQAINFYRKFDFNIVKPDIFHLTVNHISPCYIMFLKY